MPQVQVWLRSESGAFSGANYLSTIAMRTAYSALTSQLVTNLQNGYYKLTADGPEQRRPAAGMLHLSGNDKMTSLPVSHALWTNATIVRGIAVTNGQCLVSLYSNDTNGGNWCALDFVQLIKDDLPFTLLKGGDISELTYVEQGGGKYFETNGQPMDCLQILKNHGCNIVRLRHIMIPAIRISLHPNLCCRRASKPRPIFCRWLRAQRRWDSNSN